MQKAKTKAKESAFFKEFREFINRGNMVDLAIGIAVGGAFTAIVNSLVNDVLMPIASLTFGGLDFSTISIDIPNIFGANSTAHIAIGNFLQNIVNFLSIALVVFIFVRLINNINRAKEKADAEAAKHRKDLKAARDQKAADQSTNGTNATKSSASAKSGKSVSDSKDQKSPAPISITASATGANLSIKNPFIPNNKK